jgi:type VI secretion system secreted protein Hcp
VAQVDYFLKIAGMDGESADDKHKGEIDVESFSWGEINEGTAGHGTGAGAGKVQMQDFHFTKKLDKASSRLFIACATGEHIKSAILTARKAGGGQQEYLKITLEDAMVTNYQIGGSGAGETVPLETVALNFAKIEFSYKEQKPDGSLGGEAKQKYDLSANKKI